MAWIAVIIKIVLLFGLYCPQKDLFIYLLTELFCSGPPAGMIAGKEEVELC